MKLIYKIAISLSSIMLVFMALWGVLFFRVMISEINDETDDMLEEYSQDIIIKWLSGARLPSTDNGTNNTYYIRQVTALYADANQRIRYEDADIFIASQGEREPARIRRQVFMDVDGSYYELTVAVPSFEREDLVRSILWSIVILYFVLLLALVAITVVVIKFNMRPFDALMKWYGSYVPGKSNPPVPADTDAIEFRRLAEAAQSAVDRFERQFEQQKQFISNASHELQTPLAVCSARIEMLLDSPGLTEEQAGELVKMQRTIMDLTRLNRTLLLMSKIENGQFPESADVDIAGLVRESMAMFSEVYVSKNLETGIDVSGECVWKMNPQLASVLVNNLLKNAFNHSPEKSFVRVCLEPSCMRVTNAGHEPLDSNRIFTRFYRENSRKEGSTGLGLALVKAVCDSSGLTVKYEYDGAHNFIVRNHK